MLEYKYIIIRKVCGCFSVDSASSPRILQPLTSCTEISVFITSHSKGRNSLEVVLEGPRDGAFDGRMIRERGTGKRLERN